MRKKLRKFLKFFENIIFGNEDNFSKDGLLRKLIITNIVLYILLFFLAVIIPNFHYFFPSENDHRVRTYLQHKKFYLVTIFFIWYLVSLYRSIYRKYWFKKYNLIRVSYFFRFVLVIFLIIFKIIYCLIYFFIIPTYNFIFDLL